MIHKIEIENFHSIRDRQVLDLRAPANAPKDTDRLAECWRGSIDRAPKVIAVFGANGSGKSNLLRALSFAAWFIRSSFSMAPKEGIPHEPFNDEGSFDRPTRLRVWSSGLEDLSAAGKGNGVECQYCYELAIGNSRDGKRHVVSEGIFRWPTTTKRRTRLFERFVDGSVKASDAFALSGYKSALEKVLRPNASVISTLAQLNHPVSEFIAEIAYLVKSNIFLEKVEFEEEAVLRRYIADPQIVERFNREISRMDAGVREIEITLDGRLPKVLFRHEGLAFPMPTVLESHGTRQFLKLFPIIADALDTGGIAVIDELDAAIHPMLLPEIVGWFHDPSRNPNNAQLWMSCNNASLLEDLSKDEIVFCEKRARGRTELYCLNDVKGVRRNDNYYRKYLGGVFGAVPRVG